MLGNILPRRKGIKEMAASAVHPVLPFYHRDKLTPRAQRRLTIAFFIASFVFGFFFAILPNESKAMLTVPLFVMAAFILWLLPETGRAPTRFLTAMFFSYFIALILWPYYLAFQIPGMPLIEIRRAFLFLAILGLLISLSVSSAFKQHMKDLVETWPTFFKMLIAFVVVQALSLVATPYPNEAIMAFLRIQLACTAIFFITIYVMSQPGRILVFANLIRFVAVALSVMAIFEYRNQGLLWAGHIPSFLQVSDPAMINLLDSTFRAGDYRVTTTFSVSLCLAEFLALTLPFFLQYLVTGRNRLFKVILVICDLLVMNAILLTQARVGIVGIAVTHGIYGFILALRFWRAHKESLLGPAALLMYPVGMAVFAVAAFTVPRLRVMWLGNGVQAASTQGRLEQAAEFPGKFIARPLFGYGPSQGGRVLGYTNPAGEVSIDSGLLAIPLNYGAVGAVLYFGMFIYLFVQGMKLSADAKGQEDSYAMPVAVTMIFWLISRIVIAQEDNASFMYMLMGTLIALAYRHSRQSSASAGMESNVASGSEDLRPRGGFHVPGFARS